MSIIKKGVKLSPHHKEKVLAKLSKAWRRDQSGANNPFHGKRHTDETRALLSAKFKGKHSWNLGIVRSPETVAKLRKPKSPEHKRKLSESKLRYFADPTHRAIQKANRARQIIPFEDTHIEKIIQKGLTDIGITFERHKRIEGRPDIFILPNICIFCDGDYWHANPSFFNNNDIIINGKTAKEIRDKDNRITEFLRALGYTVLRFWESDIHSNSAACIAMIKDCVPASR